MSPGVALAATVVEADVRRLGLPTGVKEFVLPSGHRSPTELGVLLVRLVDDDGTVGYSFLWTQEARQLPLFEAVLRYFAGQVIGHRLDESPSLVSSLRRSTNFIGYEGLSAYGVSGYEMALQDLACRRLDVSLGALLGRVRQRVPAYQTGLFLWSSPEELVAEAKEMYQSGLRAMKMQVGAAHIEEDVERLRAVVSSLPDGVAIMADAVQRWSYPDALRAAESFAEFELVWLEDPLDYDDLASYRRLVERSPIPIATGESQYSPGSYRRLVEAGVPYLIGDLERVGGVSGWMRLADLARQSGSVILPHIYPHVSTQLVAAVDAKEVWWEYVPWFDELVGYDFELLDGQVIVPDRPGSGFDPSLDAVEDLARGPWTSLGPS